MLLAALGCAAPTCAAAQQTLSSLLSVQFVGNVGYLQQFSTAKSLGVRNVRIAVRANDVVDRMGRYSWTLADARIQPLIRAGIRPIITIYGAPPAAVASGDPKRLADAYADFAGQTVHHFGAQAAGRPIIYEFWNEPNTKTFWGSAPNPEAYAAMALSACQAVRRSTPGAVVVGLAMEGTPVKAPYVVPAYKIDIYREWAARAYTADLASCLDGVSMHPYRGAPESYISDEPGFAAFLARSWRKPRPPLVANTEWGYAVNQKKGFGEAQQAAMDLRAALIGASFQRVTNLYMAVDPNTPGADPLDGFGLVTSAGADKAAAKALRTLLKSVGPCEPERVKELPGKTGVFAVRFRCPPGSGSSQPIAVWTARGSGEVGAAELTATPSAQVVDLVTGERRPLGASIAVSETPVLVVPK